MSASSVRKLLGLRSAPVAVAFLDTVPSDLPKWEGGAAPAGCAFWKKAQEGRAFYTVPADHYNCAVGAYTHNIPLPDARASELESTVGFMVQSDYIRMDEVAGIPRLSSSPAAVAYGPLDDVALEPDLVVVAAQPAQAMLLFEAAARAGAAGGLRTIGRPACAALSLAARCGEPVVSLGCRGNRTFTGLPDEELYVVIPGGQWDAVAAEAETIATANETMGQRYAAHRATFPEL